MTESTVWIALAAAAIGGSLGLAGTALTLRHHGRQSRAEFFQDKLSTAVGDVLASVNLFAHAIGNDSNRLTERWLNVANADDRLALIIPAELKSQQTDLRSGVRRMYEWRQSGH